MTNFLTVEMNRKACAFNLHITDPNNTLRALSLFFMDRKIPIDNLHMHRYRDGEAMIIIHCQIEKDRIPRTVELLEALPGIVDMEKLQGK